MPNLFGMWKSWCVFFLVRFAYTVRTFSKRFARDMCTGFRFAFAGLPGRLRFARSKSVAVCSHTSLGVLTLWGSSSLERCVVLSFRTRWLRWPLTFRSRSVQPFPNVSLGLLAYFRSVSFEKVLVVSLCARWPRWPRALRSRRAHLFRLDRLRSKRFAWIEAVRSKQVPFFRFALAGIAGIAGRLLFSREGCSLALNVCVFSTRFVRKWRHFCRFAIHGLACRGRFVRQKCLIVRAYRLDCVDISAAFR